MGFGGSLYARGTVHIDICRFINSTANFGNGGAVCLSGFNSTINGSYFEANRAVKKANAENGGAGAVFINASNTTIKHSKFINNKAGLNGGAVGSSDKRIQNCTITNCTFTNNTAQGSAGAVGMQSSNFVISNSTFKHNEAKGAFTTYPGNGGGMVMRGWDSYAYNCTFINNTAAQHGGAVFSTNTTFNPINNNTGFELCTFINNTAGSNGGAVDWAAGATYGYIIDCNFTNNTAKRSGGAVHWSGHYGIVSNSTFTNNNATGDVISVIGGVTGGGDGGAIVWVGSHGIINDSCIFTGNYAKNRGGAVFMHGNATENCTNVTVDDCTFKYNEAGLNGGAVDWYKGAQDGKISNSVFRYNTAKYDGGAVYWSGYNGTIENTNFTYNFANQTGGAVYWEGDDGAINGSIFKYNNVSGIWNKSTPVVNYHNPNTGIDEVHYNITGGDGGAIIWKGSNAEIENSTFYKNYAPYRGGAIFFISRDNESCENVTIKTGNFTLNTAGMNGGALDWAKGAHNATILGSYFNNNTAGRSAGAIYVSGNDLDIEDTVFNYNRVTGETKYDNRTDGSNYTSIGGNGGAICWMGSYGDLDNVTFLNNTATQRGGAIQFEKNMNTTIENSRFTNNSAGTEGGAIDFYNGAENGKIINSNFTNNTAYENGGAIYWQGHYGLINGSRFENNNVIGLGDGVLISTDTNPNTGAEEKRYNITGGDGGAIKWTGSHGIIENTTFYKNTATYNGGAIYLIGNETENCTNITFIDCNFTQNLAKLNGGAVYWAKGSSNAAVNGTYFINNTAKRSAGAIYISGDYLNIKDTQFKYNEATEEQTYDNRTGSSYFTSPGGNAGAICWMGSYGTVDNGTFINNTAADRGGAIQFERNENGTVKNSYFENNTAASDGGAIDWYKGAVNGQLINSTFRTNYVTNGDARGSGVYIEGYNATIKDSRFYEHHSITDGGVIYIEGHEATIDNTTFKDINTTKRGGAIFVDGHNATIKDSNFTAVYALMNGGAIYIEGQNTTISGSKFNGTSSIQKGGAIYVEGRNASIIGSDFINSTSSDDDGGALYVIGEECKLYNSTFENNTAADDGGAIYWQGNYGEIYNITCVNNNATSVGTHHSKGGTICLTANDTAVNKSRITGSFATYNGGAMFITGNNVNITESDFKDCRVDVTKKETGDDLPYGGALYVLGDNTTVGDCTFDNCTAIRGGIIYVEGDHVKVDNATCRNSSATKYGGAFYVDGINATISNSSVENTNASLSGGAIYIHGVDATIDSSSFEKTNAFGSTGNGGGAIFIDGARAVVKKSNFTDTEAANNTHAIGGAIYITGANVNVTDSNFKNTKANLKGGAIYINGANTTIKDSNFTKAIVDTSGSQGGAIYVDGVNAVIDGSDFDQCSALASGGSIYVDGKNTTISYSNFTKSKVTAIGGYGGSIYVNGNETKILYSNFSESQITSKNSVGGAIYITGAFALINGSTFEKCLSTGDDGLGGAVYLNGNNGTVDSSVFNNNKANKAGGGLYSDGTGSKVYNSNFTGNYAHKDEGDGRGGGAIYWIGGAKGDTIENCTFTDNHAAFGGAIRWVNKKGVVASGLIKNCTFDDNYGNKGSAISWASSNSALITLCTFINNYAYKNGCIYAGSNGLGANGVGFNITDSNFRNNSADFCGGDIACAMAYAIIKNCNFTGSKAGYGGSIVLRESSPYGTKIINCDFVNTTSAMLKGHNDGGKNGGGAIYVSNEGHNANSISIINVTITNSTSITDGGAIKWGNGDNGKDGSLINVTIINSTATSTYDNQFNTYGKGGAIYWLGNNGKFINVTVINANSKNDGGGVYVSGTGLKITGSNFINCVANKTGGAIYWNGENGVVSNTNFTNNSAINGGGIYWASTNGQVLESLFTSNNATKGGAIYWAGSNGKLDGTTFVKNNANLGGAVYWTTASSTFTNNKLYNNTATNGGGVYWDYNGGSIANTTMMYNKAVTGSAMYVKQTISDIINTTFLENQAHSYEIYNTATTVIDRTGSTITVFTYFRGNDNVLNAIYNAANRIYYTNVTYLGVGGIRNTDEKEGGRTYATVLSANQYPTSEVDFYQTNLEVYQDVTVYAYDGNNGLVMNVTGKTDYRGAISFTYTDDSFPADNINVKVFHPEDNYYTYIAFANRTKLSTVIIEVDDIYFHETEYINITVRPFNETETVSVCPGNVTVYINGELIKENLALNPDGVSGHVTIPVSGLHVDTYRVYVAYSGNGEYIPEYNSTTFRVLKIPSWITVEVDDYYYGETGKAIIRTIENASANVTVILNGREYYVEVNDTGYAEFFIPLLDAGNYTAEAYYPDTRDCYASNSTDDYNIFKVNSTLNITGVILDSLNTIKLYIDVGPSDTYGKITVLFDGKEYNLTLINSTAELTLYDVELGVYPVYAEYYGDRNHYGSNNTTVIDATKYRSYIDIDVTNITYGENETIIFTLPRDATGNLTITFNNQTFNRTIVNGKVILENLKLPAGNYTVNATYLGDDRYRGSYNEDLFIVAKAVPILEPTVENITYMDIEHIVANINQTGNVSIIIRSLINPEIIITQNLTINITNRHNVTWNVSGLARGDYFAQIIFHGNQNYTSVEVNSTFIVKPATPTIIVQANNTDVGRYNPINITVYPRENVTGNVTVYLNGENIGTYVLTDGFIRLEDVYILNNGTYDIVAVYNGDNNFTHQHNSTTFVAGGVFTKHDPDFNITATNITVLQNGEITINLPANATGIVYIKVNDTQYYVNLSETRTLILPLLGNGTYTVWANYTGDDYWNSAVNVTTFKVSKVNTTVDINVVQPVVYDGSANITVTVLEDVDGFITLTINNGTHDIKNITLPIGNGKVNWMAEGLPAGSYTVYANYTGSARYNINDTESKAFTVSPATPGFTVSEVTVDAATNATVIVKVTNATGKLNITVDGKNYTADIIGGEAVFTIDKLANGTYDVKVTYGGSTNYTYKSENFEDKVIVNKVTCYPINVTAVDVDVGVNTTITVRVPSDATGTVTIWVNGTKKVNSTIKDGVATFHLNQTIAGRYDINATLSDAKYANKTAYASYWVSKVETPIEIDVDPIYVGDKAIITVTVPKGVTNNVSIEIDGVKQNKSVDANGKAVFEMQLWSNGTRTVVATYGGDNKYVFNSTTANFTVSKRASQLNVTVTGRSVGDNATIKVEVQDNATGYVTVNVNGTNYTINLTDGEGSINITGLGNGTYYVHATYLGDRQYNPSTNFTKTFEMTKVNPTVGITVENVTYGNHTIIIVNVPGATGNITIKINETDKGEFTLTNGKVEFDAGILAADDYTVHVNYLGDDKYSALINIDKDFNVSKATPVITIDPIEVNANTNATVVVHITPGTTGRINITVNNKNYSGEIENGVAIIPIDKLNKGNYSVFANYTGDINFTNASVTQDNMVNVHKFACYNMTVTANDTKVDENTTIVVNVPSDAVGKVVIYVNGTWAGNATITEGVAKLNVTKAVAGKYVVNATFTDGKYANKTVTTNYHVFKHDSPLEIEVASILVDDVAYINVTAPSDNVTIEINGKSYSVQSYAEGVARFVVPALAYGDKTVTAIYGGSYKHVANSTTEIFTVAKHNTTINITAESITYGEKLNITVNVTDGANGFITIRINNTRNITLPINHGKVNWIVEGLAADNYTIYADYSGDAKYNINGTSKPVEVTKATPVITIYEVAIDSLNNASAIVTINTTATGTMNITVNKKNYTADIIEGIATFTVDILPVGTYNITATYGGDDNYNNASETLENGLTVNKVSSYAMNVTANDTIVGENTTIVVNVPINATGKVVIYVNGTWAGNATIDHGVAELNVTKLVSGKYIVNATLVDDKFANQTVTTAYWVSKVETPINITVVSDNIKVGDTVHVIVSVPEELKNKVVTIEINGKKYTNATDNVGNATFYIPDITYGNKTVVASYAGDNKYVFNSTTANFTVTKRASQVNVSADSTINVGDNATVTVQVPDNATGYVVVNVAGNNYTINLTNGDRSVEIAGLRNATYRVNVTYLGDDQYLSSINNTQSIKVNKVQSSINITVSNDGIIANGTSFNITVETYVDATGKVNITISNETYNKTYTIYVNDGKGNLYIESLEIGKYNVTATYLGDDKYLTSTNKTGLEIYQSVRDLIVVAGEVVAVNESESITVILEGDHNGEVAIVITNESGVVLTRNITISEHTSIYGVNVSMALTSLPLLDEGHYDAYAYYIENNGGKVILHEGTDDFNVYKLSSQITIKEIRNITVGENVTIELELEPGVATGNISVFVNDVEYKLNETNLTITIPNLGAKEYNVIAFYHENNMFNASNASAVFRVDKNDVPISINVTNSKAGEIEQINVTLPNGTTGQVLLDIGDNHYYANITNGLAQFNITGLKAGEYKVNATYLGDNKYLANNTNTSLTIEHVKVTPELVVVDQGNGTVVVVVGENATGNVTIKVGDKEFNATVVNGTAVVTLENATPGTQNVTVIYSGDDNYVNVTTTSDVTVPKYDSPINITIGEAKEGENVTVTVTVPSNATGNVTVIIDGQNYTAVIDNGTATVYVENLTAGPKSIIIEYAGDGNYTANYTVGNFTVEKAKVTPDITVVDLGNNTLVVVVGDNATGNVTVKVGDKEFNATVVNGTAVVTLENVTPGEHNITVVYSGDDIHTNATVNGTVVAPKYDTPMNVTVVGAKEGEPVEIIVEVPVGATGNVTVYVGGENHTGTIDPETGKVIITVENISAGNHTIAVEYVGDDNYAANYTIGNMTVEKAKVTPDITVVDQGNGTVVVVVGDNATGNVTVKVGDKEFNATVVNGTAVVTLDNVTPSEHNITVIYSGDDTHTNATVNSTILSPKYDTPMNVTIGEAKEGENVTVTVTVPSNATGNVTIIIDGQEYSAVIDNGTATVYVENLTAGPKSIIVEYAGDDNYASNYTVGNFTVEKAKVTPDINVVDLGNGTVVVVVGDNATGNVTIKVGDKEFNATVVNGTAVVTLENVTPGAHEIEVIYSGDDTHTNATVNSTIVAPKYDTPMNVTVGDAKEGEPVEIIVEVPVGAIGEVIIYVGGENHTGIINPETGKAIITVESISAGNHTITVEYVGDGNYAANYTIGNMTVEKAKVTPDIAVVDLGNGTVVVVVGDNATGNVTIKVGDKEFNATVVNGTAVVTLENVTPGAHEIEVLYSGDDTHTNATTVANITAPKYETPINVTVSEVKEGENTTVTITVPQNATGNVTVTIDGQKYTAEVINGTATVTVENLTAGPKSVVVEYDGDDNYASNYTVGNFTVDKAKETSEVYVVDQGNSTVVVVVPNNATGNVTVKVGDKNYTAEIVNGTAVVTVDNLTPGNNTIEVSYPGDETHTNVTVSAIVNGPKYDSPINVTVSDAKEGEPTTVTVKVPENATGNVTVTIDGQKYTAEVKNGEAVIKVENLTAGDKSLIVEYEGDDNYASNYAVDNFTVEKAKVTPDVKVIDQGNGTVVVVVGDNATGNVTVTVDGQNYNAEVIDGIAVVNMDNATAGTHDIEVVYSGDDTHDGTAKDATVTVSGQDAQITVDVEGIYVGDNATITVTVPENATGEITIEINGIPYTEKIVDGKAVFTVEGLEAGNKTVSVIYGGDKYYTHNATTGQFKVSKRSSAINATIDDSEVGENVTITVYGPEDATGQVLIDIDGVGYYVNLTCGVGVAQIPRIPSGIYNVNLTYIGDDKYVGSLNVSKFNVKKVPSFVIPVAHDIYVGELETITLTVPADATGNVTLIIDGEEYNFNIGTGLLSATYSEGTKYSVAISGGNGEIVISGLPKGEYTVSAKYNGDSKYLPAVNSTTFKVIKVEGNMQVIDQHNGTVVVKVPCDATGNVTIKVGNETYTGIIKNGSAVINLDDVAPGKHDIEVTYSGDGEYSPKTINSTVEIPKSNTPISVEAQDIYVGETEIITVTLPDDATGDVTIEINGKEYTSTIEDGKAVFEVEGLIHGEKTVAVKYDGDDKYAGNSTTGQFTVYKVQSTVSAKSKDVVSGKTETITATVPKDATGQVLIYINDVGYYGDIINGKAKITLPYLPAGKYTGEVIYEGDEKYLPSNNTVSFTVSATKTPISAIGDEIKVGNDGKVVVELPEDATGTVKIAVEGKTYIQPVKFGKATFSVPGLDKGQHEVVVSYSGDDKYPANSTTTKIIVDGDNPDDNKTKHHANAGQGVNLATYSTGNPIFVLLLIILVIGSTQLRRFRK